MRFGITHENGIRWDQASEAQKAEGGFVKDNVVYDGRVYYWMGTVKAVEILAGDGSTYTDYILSKSRFLDSDYTQPDEETTFFNFSNTYVPDLGGVEFTKVDGAGEGIQGAEFALFTDETCQTPAINIDGDKQAWTAASDEEGLVKFDGVRTGTYYMKETRAPENYALDRTVYKVVIEDSKDTTKVSKITINNDESGTAISTIANTEEGKLSIIKKWISPSGDEEDGGDKSARVKLYRKLDNSNIPEASEVTVVYHRDGKGWDLDTGTGNVVNVNGVSSFDLLWHLGNSPDHQLYNMKVNGVSVTTQNEVVDLGFARVNWIPWDGSTSKLCVSNIKKNLRIEYTSNCDWFSEKPHVENFVPFISPVIDPTPQEVKTIILNSENNWAVDQRIGGKLSDYEENGYDLPATNDDGYEYLYYVVELDASGNEIEVGGSPVAGYFLQGYSANNNVGVANQGILTIYNKAEEVPASIKIIKVIKGTETALTGAKFTLTRVDNNGNEPTDKNDRWTSGEQEVDENGMLTFDNLKSGRYKLEETEAPSGYIKKEGPYFIIVNPDGTTSLDTSIPHTLITKSEDADEYTVQNEPGAALPNTGGPGSAMIYFLGIMLTGLAGAGLVMTKHRKTA